MTDKMIMGKARSDLTLLASIATRSPDSMREMFLRDAADWTLPNPWVKVSGIAIWDATVADDMLLLVSSLLGLPQGGGWFTPALFETCPGWSSQAHVIAGGVLLSLLADSTGASSPSIEPVEYVASEEAADEFAGMDTTWLPIGASFQPSASRVVVNVKFQRAATTVLNPAPRGPGLGGGSSSGSTAHEQEDSA